MASTIKRRLYIDRKSMYDHIATKSSMSTSRKQDWLQNVAKKVLLEGCDQLRVEGDMLMVVRVTPRKAGPANEEVLAAYYMQPGDYAVLRAEEQENS